MGFQRPTYKLVWPEGHSLHGLEIRTRGLSIGDLQEVTKHTSLDGIEKLSQVEQLKRAEPLLEIFAEKLISWNYEDEDGQPIGTTLQEIRAMDLTVILPIVQTWVSEVSTVSDPLPNASSSGAPSLEASIPMDVSSPNPMSSPSVS